MPISNRLSFIFLNEMASSKSFASFGSIVQVRTFLKSRLFGISCSISLRALSFIFFASFSTWCGKVLLKPLSRAIEAISASLSPFLPIISISFPVGASFGFFQFKSSNSILYPGSTSAFISTKGTCIFLLSAMPKVTPDSLIDVPTKLVCFLAITSTTAPSFLPWALFFPVSFTLTSSPDSAIYVSSGAISISSSTFSCIKKPIPFEFMLILPLSNFSDLSFFNIFFECYQVIMLLAFWLFCQKAFD